MQEGQIPSNDEQSATRMLVKITCYSAQMLEQLISTRDFLLYPNSHLYASNRLCLSHREDGEFGKWCFVLIYVKDSGDQENQITSRTLWTLGILNM